MAYEDLVPLADVVFVSKDVSLSNGATNLHEAIELFKPKLKDKGILICTWGDQGSAGVDQEGQVSFVQAAKVEKIIDSCGAGDTFTASIIASLIKNQTLKTALEFASKMTAKKLGQFGFKNLKI